MKSKLLAIFFRFSGISGKFLVVFLITKKISLEFQGEYTLINTNIALLIIFLGLDFYTYTNRVIVKQVDKLVFVLKNSLVFYGIMYLFFIPVLMYMTHSGLVPKNLAVLFFFLTITEHLSQELFRIYIAIEKVTLANILFFLRTGTWSWAISIYLIFIENSNVTLFNILMIWLVFSFVSVIIGLFFIPNIKSFSKEKVDKKIIYEGTKVALLMFVSTIFLKMIEYSDRYFINYFLGKKELGIYAFYYQISNIINVVIFTLYISYAYPKILKIVYKSDLISLKKEKKKLTNNTLIIILIALFLSFTILPYILDIVGKSELTKNIGIVYILIFASLFFNLSFSSHFILVAEEKEKLILKATIVACFINLLLNLILLPILGVYGSAVALLISSFVLFIIKAGYEKNTISKWKK
tara:strand:+ start:1534 stop:2763 length:1230 start_codon:yes stop_codon:yes gene_type:complete